MPVDPIQLLSWMASRERRRAVGVDGAELMVDARHLAAPEDLDPREALARAIEALKQMDCISWRAEAGASKSLAPGEVDQDLLRQVGGIRVSATGHSLCLAGADKYTARQGITQINIFNKSSVGQLGMGENRIGDIRVMLAMARSELEAMDVDQEVKEEARGTLEKMQSLAESTAGSAAASLISAALQSAMGMK